MPELETIPCPYCDSQQADRWGEENGYTAARCHRCGLVFVNPRPTPDMIDEAVRLGVHETERGTLDMSAFSARIVQHKIAQLSTRLLQVYSKDELARQPLHWLDIGAGYGELLMALQAITGPQAGVIGVEPCWPKLEKAREMGAQVVESLAAVDGPFDHLSLINVFSHLPDPAAFLSDIRGKLAPHGDLLLVTGNGGDVSRSDYPDQLYLPDHLIFAGEKHVIGFLERAGFELVRIHRYRQFLPEEPRPLRSILINLARHSVRRLLGHPSSYRLIRQRGPFRSLWVRAHASNPPYSSQSAAHSPTRDDRAAPS